MDAGAENGEGEGGGGEQEEAAEKAGVLEVGAAEERLLALRFGRGAVSLDGGVTDYADGRLVRTGGRHGANPRPGA